MKNYWEQRKFQEETALADISEKRLLKKIAKEYQRMQRAIILDMENLYYKILEEGGSSEALMSHLYRYQGYYQTLNTVQQKLIGMGSTEIEQIDSSLQKLYIANGNRVTKQFNLPFDPTEEQVRNVVNKIWCNDQLSFSQRIWGHQNQLLNRLNATLVDAVARGVNADKLTENLMYDFGVSFYDASRIVRTETSRIMVDSAVDGYAEAGIEEYEVLADQSGVCKHCESFNRKRFRLNEQQIGVNCPPFHPNCKCSIIGVV